MSSIKRSMLQLLPTIRANVSRPTGSLAAKIVASRGSSIRASAPPVVPRPCCKEWSAVATIVESIDNQERESDYGKHHAATDGFGYLGRITGIFGSADFWL
jgi:hypothetical protein